MPSNSTVGNQALNKLPLFWLSYGTHAQWNVNCARADFYLAPAKSLAEALPVLYALVGMPARLPDYALGLILSRSGWTDYNDMISEVSDMRENGFGVDAVVADYEWFTPTDDSHLNASGSDAFSDFDWNNATFPAPASDLDLLHNLSVAVGGVRWPRLGNSDNIKQAAQMKCLLNDQAGSRNLNFNTSTCISWYAQHLTAAVNAGMDFFWNVDGATAYYVYLSLAEAEGEALSNSAVTRQGFGSGQRHPQTKVTSRLPLQRRRALPTATALRPFHIARSHVPGLHVQGGAVSTGIMSTSWTNLGHSSVHMLSYTLSGSPYYTGEVGGSTGEADTTLLVRWYQAGIFYPLMRVHEYAGNNPRFPNAFTGSTGQLLLACVQMRYNLLPMFRALAYNAAQGDGLPIVRPLVMHFPSDSNVTTLATQWLLGSSVLVAPMLTPTPTRDIYLPAGDWYAFNSTRVIPGQQHVIAQPEIDDMLIFVRKGSLVLYGANVLSTADTPRAPVLVMIYPGADANFTMVEDDGVTLGSSNVRLTAFSWDDTYLALSWSVQSTYSGPRAYSVVQAVCFFPDGAVYTRVRNLGEGGYFNFAELRAQRGLPLLSRLGMAYVSTLATTDDGDRAWLPAEAMYKLQARRPRA